MKMKLLTAVAVVATAGLASAGLVPNGDFLNGSTSWSSFADPDGTVVSFETTGGSTLGTLGGSTTDGGYGLIDATAGSWGGGLVSPADFEYTSNQGTPLATLGVTAGETITISIDMINLVGNGLGGLKMEAWNGGGGAASYTADIAATGQSSVWDTYTWDYTIPAGTLSLKIVPLLTPNYTNPNVNSKIGFDNVGVVPEPATMGLFAVFGAGLWFMRRSAVRNRKNT